MLEKYFYRSYSQTVKAAAYKLINDKEDYEIETILDFKVRYRKPQYLVKWKNWPNEYNEWLNESSLGNAKTLLRQYKKRAQKKS